LGATDFSIVPVIDLLGGVVVRARAGERASYAPIVTPLSPSAEPRAVVAGLLRAWPARHLYIADLDAIQGRGRNAAAVAAIARDFPQVEIWVDAGFSRETEIRGFGLPGRARPVIGTESQTGPDLVRHLGASAILSLDYRGEERLGPAILHDDSALWPTTVIVMTLARVGMDAGPDRARLAAVKRRAGERAVYAAGGVRDLADCEALREDGIAGALVASAIHAGRIRRDAQSP
jgi:phosphoribosylformimino-5-aminoimidazole carboxamide ribotide isomerase